MGNYADKLAKKNPDQKFTIVKANGDKKTYNGGNNGNGNAGNKGKNDKNKGPNKPNKPGKTGTHTTIAGTPALEKAPKMRGPVPENTDYLGNIPDGYTKKTRGNWRDRAGMSQGPTDKPFFKHTQRGRK